MSYWKRGIKYLVRKKNRTILLTILLFMMSCFVLVGISLKSSADKETENLRQSLGTGFILEVDYQNEAYSEIRDDVGYSYKAYTGPVITNEMIDKIMGIDGVSDYKLNLIAYVWTNLEFRPGLWAYSEVHDGLTQEQLELWKQQTQVLACKKGERDANFSTGAFNISEGRNIQEEDHFKAVISEWLAEKNGLALGDILTIETKEGIYKPSEEPFKTWGEPVKLEIVGLFHPNFAQPFSIYTAEGDYVESMIYTDLDTYAALQKNFSEYDMESISDIHSKVTFFVEDPAELESIMQQIRELDSIDIDGLIFRADDTAYQASVKPFQFISIFSTIILVAGIVGISIILYLVMNLWVKGRTHEVGILLSIGIKKGKIVCQMLAECLIVSAAALILSILLSGVMVDQCARAAERMTAPSQGKEPYTVQMTSVGEVITVKNTSDEVSLDHSVSINTVLIMVVVVCGLSMISVLLASVRVLEMEPKRLLQSI